MFFFVDEIGVINNKIEINLKNRTSFEILKLFLLTKHLRIYEKKKIQGFYFFLIVQSPQRCYIWLTIQKVNGYKCIPNS